MTNNEAIGILAIVVETAKGRCFVTDEAISDAYAMAISALQEHEAKAQLSAEGTTNLQPTCNKLATDCISRQAAIDALDCINGVEEVLRALPSAQSEPQWISVSERLPEVGKDVMVCYDFKGHRSVLIGVLYGDEKFHGYDDEYLTPEGRKYRKAVAWMPLPEPYRAERKTDEKKNI